MREFPPRTGFAERSLTRAALRRGPLDERELGVLVAAVTGSVAGKVHAFVKAQR